MRRFSAFQMVVVPFVVPNGGGFLREVVGVLERFNKSIIAPYALFVQSQTQPYGVAQIPRT